MTDQEFKAELQTRLGEIQTQLATLRTQRALAAQALQAIDEQIAQTQNLCTVLASLDVDE